MTIAYFDCFSGIAGDMTLAALLDCGVPLDELRAGLASLDVEGWNIEAEPVLKNGIHAMSARITLHGVSDDEEQQQSAKSSRQETAREYSHSHSHAHGNEHPHEHSHDHEHSHTHEHDAAHTHHSSLLHSSLPHTHGRSMAEIRALIISSTLNARVQETALKIFGVIAQAEAKMHHTTPDEVHFHEIGGVDSLIDICGVAWCLDYLGVDEIYCSALPHSTGHVHCAHGIMPVPAPATLEILQDAPFFPTGLEGEMITPTGAAIIKALAVGFEFPAFTPRKIGVGAGRKNFADRPNILRVSVGEKTSSTRTVRGSSALDGLEIRTLSLVETNIDDMNPELWDHVLSCLLQAGALDVWLENVQMKKNRPAQTLRVLVSPELRDEIITIVLRETTTLGVRISQIERVALERESKSVQTQWGEVRLKVASWRAQNLERAAPEYDDVARIARENNIAAREVYDAAMALFWSELK